MSHDEKGASEVLGELQSKGDHFTKLSVIERKRMADLQDALDYISQETEKYRAMSKKVAIEVMNKHVLTPNPAYSRADGVDVGRQARQVTMKALNILEWKLNKLLQQKSEIIIENKKLKSEIDHYRRLRLQTDVSHAKFEQILAETKEKIEAFLSESSAVVEERERYIEKKEALERINLEEQRIFQAEYEELGLFIKQQNDALGNALLAERKADNKASKSGGDTIGNNSVAGKGGENATFLTDPMLEALQTDLTLEEEVEMARQVGTLSEYVANEAESLQSVQAKIRSYELMFEQLKKMTNTNSMEEVVSTYVYHEEEMFSLYNFMQSLQTEMDSVLEAQNQMTLDIEAFKEAQREQNEQRTKVLDALRKKVEACKEASKAAEEQLRTLQESVSHIAKKVHTIFFKLQCEQLDNKGSGGAGGGGGGGQGSKSRGGVTMSKPESKVALLTGQTVSESNVLDFMGCIEQRSVEIIQEYLRVTNALEKGPNLRRPGSPTPGPASPMKWPIEPVVDLADLEVEDLLFENAAPVQMTSKSLFGSPSALGGGGAASGADDGDDKLVDLNQFKEKLSKKLGLDQTKKTGPFR